MYIDDVPMISDGPRRRRLRAGEITAIPRGLRAEPVAPYPMVKQQITKKLWGIDVYMYIYISIYTYNYIPICILYIHIIIYIYT